jgi:hypothetical protein
VGTMRKRRIASIAFTGAAVATGTGLHAPAALAASPGTWTVTHGGKFTATGTASFGGAVTLKCSTARLSGSISKTTFTQTGSTPFQAGTITGTFGSTNKPCTSPEGLVKVTGVLKKGALYAAAYKSGVTHGTIKSISATITGENVACSATIKGSQPYSYNNDGKLTVLGTSGDPLTTTAVTGCLGVIKKSDKIFFDGVYTVAGTAPVISRSPAN